MEEMMSVRKRVMLIYEGGRVEVDGGKRSKAKEDKERQGKTGCFLCNGFEWDEWDEWC
jgi:hypothetical protein